MVVLDALTVSNFKRYAGTHRIPLSPEEGTLTIVAAQNGVGKTSLIDALHVGLWGKRGYMARHPGEDRGRFDRWLANAFAVGAEEDYPHLRFAVDVSCPINGNIRIERVYWLLDIVVSFRTGFATIIMGHLLNISDLKYMLIQT